MQYTCKIQRIRACSKQQPLESWERVDERTVDWESFGWKTDDRILKTTGQLWMFLRLLSTLLVGCRFFAVPETEHQKRKRETLLSSHGKAWSETIPTLSYWVPPGVFLSGLGADSVPGYTINYFGRPFETQTLQKARFAVLFSVRQKVSVCQHLCPIFGGSDGWSWSKSCEMSGPDLRGL